jgi:CrcB protein
VRLLTPIPLVAVGGVLGSLGRYSLDLALPWGAGVPWATLIVNLVGAFAIGVLATSIVEMRPWVRPFAITGVLGGFTTFSAFALQTGVLVDRGCIVSAVAYIALTLAGGLLAVSCGAALGARLRRTQP